MIKISFKDFGIGIFENELFNVFNFFFRALNNNKNSLGIGFYLFKEFVFLYYGIIELKLK